MIGHEFDSGLNVEQVQGQAYVVDNDSRITPLQPGMQIAPNQVLLTNENSSLVVSHDGERYFVDSQCASCLVPLDDNQHGFASSAISATFNPDALDSDSAFDLDVAQLQNLIAQGVDPTEVFEEAAAGENAGSSNAGFIVVNYNYDSTLTEAGFDTLGPLSGDDTTEDFLVGKEGEAALTQILSPQRKMSMLRVVSLFHWPLKKGIWIRLLMARRIPSALRLRQGQIACFPGHCKSRRMLLRLWNRSWHS